MTSQPRLARSITAFANSEGGIIIVGVDDDGHIKGVESISDTIQAIHTCLDMIDPRPVTTLEKTSLDGADLVICRIPRGEDKPYQVQSRHGIATYIRAGSSIRPIAKAKQVAEEDHFRKNLKVSPLQKAIMITINTEEGIRLVML